MIGGPDVLLTAVGEWLSWSKRRRALRSVVQQTIEAEGGEIDGISIIGFMLKSPFPRINLRPVYLKAVCRYPNDSGRWFICGIDGGETLWVWCSDTEAKEAPVKRPKPVRVDNAVLALSPWLSILLCIAFYLGVAGLVYCLCVSG